MFTAMVSLVALGIGVVILITLWPILLWLLIAWACFALHPLLGIAFVCLTLFAIFANN